MTDAPKIDTQAPDRIWAWANHDFRRWYAGGCSTEPIMDGTHCVEYLRRDLADARAAAAAQAMREAAAMAGHAQADGNTRHAVLRAIRDLPLPDTAALDRLIAERVREALIEVRDLIADRRNAQEPGPLFGAYNEAMGDVEAVRFRRARGSKEGQP